VAGLEGLENGAERNVSPTCTSLSHDAKRYLKLEIRIYSQPAIDYSQRWQLAHYSDLN